METALNEITLVLFTTIAPAGVMGYLTMALAIVLSRDEERAAAISRYLVVPLVLAISGLIASATHLGTPANALYVITGIGRSPLSNEVVAAVAFLALGGVYWILSFRDDLRRPFRVAWLAATAAAGFVFVGYIAVAYSVPSVPTWNLPTAPLTLWLNALSSGPLVGLFGLLLARQEPNRGMVAALLALLFVVMPSVQSFYQILSQLTVLLYLIMYMLMFSAAIVLRYKMKNTDRPFRLGKGNGLMWFLGCLGFCGALLAFVLSFVPPSQISTGSNTVWFSVLIIGCVVVVGAPFVIYAMRKPSWKDPEAAADFAPFHWEQQPVVAAPVHTNAPEPMAKPSDTELHNK